MGGNGGNLGCIMTDAQAEDGGIRVTFADGKKGVVPFTDIPGVGSSEGYASLKTHPNVLLVFSRNGEAVELPWDFVRHYCDSDYRAQEEAEALAGRKVLGERIRRARERVKLSQEKLAAHAGIGRVTLTRIENGEQSPRFDTLLAIARGLGQPLEALLAAAEATANERISGR